MASENPTWGAPRIHGELLMLGVDVSERSVSRWVKRCRNSPDPAKQCLTFLWNHREAIAAMDFFTVPTLTFGVPHCFFVISHNRRRVLHYDVTPGCRKQPIGGPGPNKFFRSGLRVSCAHFLLDHAARRSLVA